MATVEQNKSMLTEHCGHHCGVQMTGSKQYIGHCDCSDCHNGAVALMAGKKEPKPDPKESISE